jgi:hypothetical protein
MPRIDYKSPAEIKAQSARSHANLMRRIREVFPSGRGSQIQRPLEPPGHGPSATEAIASALACGMIARNGAAVTTDQVYEVYKCMYDEVSIQRGE